MAQVIEMPKLSDTMEDGGIAEWFKKEGELIEEGEPLVAIETDKATIEYASPLDGHLLKILVEPGKRVALKEAIAVFGEKGEAFELEKLIQNPSTQTSDEKSQKEDREEKKQATSSPSRTDKSPASSPERLRASPLAKKIAREEQIDLSRLQGSGPGGRIVKSDLASGVKEASKVAEAVTSLSRRSDQKLDLSSMRKTIATRLLAAKNEAPHFYLQVSAKMDSILAWRTKLNSHKAVKAGQMLKVSVNDLICLATARALRLHPEINSSWQEDHILQHGSVHLAMAVALPEGLMTPVIRDCDQLSIRQIASATKSLAHKTKENRLSADEFSGGTFTISNLGMTKVESFTAIINPPQAAILAVGSIKNEVGVGEHGNFVVEKKIKMTLSCDHRVIDGMQGAKFCETLCAFLEDPVMIFSEA